MARGKTEAAASKLKTATGLAALGGSIGGPIGAGVGAVTGLIIGDDTTVFPIDMVAIPAYQAYLINGNAAFSVYIKAGETLVPLGVMCLTCLKTWILRLLLKCQNPKRKERDLNGIFTRLRKVIKLDLSLVKIKVY